jgi:hypothetical protein
MVVFACIRAVDRFVRQAPGAQSPGVPTLHPRRSLPIVNSDVPLELSIPKRVHSISPRSSGVQPGGSSPASRDSPEASPPLHSHRRASSGGCSPASSEASCSPSQSIPPTGAGFSERSFDSSRELPSQKRTPRLSGPVRDFHTSCASLVRSVYSFCRLYC